MKKLLTFALLAALVLAGCKKDDPAPDPDPALAPPTIATHPANQEVTVGGVPATFTVAATGGKTPYTYLWEWFTTGSWNGINDNTAMWSGRTTPTLTVNALSMFNSDQFRCIVKDANNATVKSNAATLTVTAATPPLKIDTHPANKEVAEGGTATFSVAASGGKTPYTYQWQYKTTTGTTWSNGSASGATSATLTLIPGIGANGWQYRCRVRDANNGEVFSNPATLTVTPPLVFTDSPSYNIPASTVGTAIANINVASGASGGKTPYTFTAAGLPLGIYISAAGVISGTPNTARSAGTATITVKDNTTPTAQTKSITINFGAVTAAAASLPVIETQPFDRTTTTTGTTYFTVMATGTGLSYYWQFRTGPAASWTNAPDDSIYSYVSSDQIEIAKPPTSMNGYQYRCLVSNSAGDVFSNFATLTVNP